MNAVRDIAFRKAVAWRSADALPGLAAAEQAAEGAALNPQGVRVLEDDGGVVVAAAVGIMDAADPFAVLRLHIDQDLLARLLGIAADVRAARLDYNIALAAFGGPQAERRVRVCGCCRGGLNGRGCGSNGGRGRS